MKLPALFCLALVLAPGLSRAVAATRPNVLFIAVDDLRPELACFGKTQVVSPNIDRLAARGVRFERAYCQQAICNASRASLLTGLRPDSTGVYDLVTHFRQKVPDVVTLPEHFKHSGYHTQALGKIFHPAFHQAGIGSDMGDPRSWSVPIWLGSPRYYFSKLGERLARAEYARTTGKSGAELEGWKDDSVRMRVLATEAPDVPDRALYDGELTERAVAALQDLARQQASAAGSAVPFFLAVGFLKPHLPFIAPKKYWDLYDPVAFTPVQNAVPPREAPPIALQIEMDELRDTYPKDVRVTASPDHGGTAEETYDIPRRGRLAPEQERRLLHGYHACISFVDAQVGRLLDELDRLKLGGNTIIVFWGDHGFHLGEHGLWGKLTNFETATRAPLIVCAPDGRSAGRKTAALVELVDIYPSLCDLAGLARPPHLEGASFAALLRDPAQPGKPAAFSQYPRGKTMGYSMRTDRHRLTLWSPEGIAGQTSAVELYDHQTDPGENVNLAGRPAFAPLVGELAGRLRDGWKASLRSR